MLSLVRRAEDACIAAWPAPRQVLMDGWLLRFGGGHTSRANSVDVVGPSSRAAADKVAACEALYGAQRLPTIFRLSDAMPQPDLTPALDAADYGPPRDASLVLFAESTGPRTDRGDATLTEGPPDARWLAASAALAGLDAAAAALRARILDALVVPAAFAAGRSRAPSWPRLSAPCTAASSASTPSPRHRRTGGAGSPVAPSRRCSAGRRSAMAPWGPACRWWPTINPLWRSIVGSASRASCRATIIATRPGAEATADLCPELAPRAVSVHLRGRGGASQADRLVPTGLR